MLTTQMLYNDKSQVVRSLTGASFKNEKRYLIFYPSRAELGAALLGGFSAETDADNAFIGVKEAECVATCPLKDREPL